MTIGHEKSLDTYAHSQNDNAIHDNDVTKHS